MRKIFRFFWRQEVRSPAQSWSLSEAQREELLGALSDLGLQIVREARAPVPLYVFGRRMLRRLELTDGADVSLPEFADALKQVLLEMDHRELRVMSPSDCIGVGYVYNIGDRETHPIRNSG